MTERDFPPDRDAALARLAGFVPRSGVPYARDRGLDLPGQPHVSRLSPYLRHRAVTEAEVAAAVPRDAEKFLSELMWRAYFKGWLERRPGIWQAYRHGLDRARDRLATESGLRRAFGDACAGRTGIAPFDHWARDLTGAGYLHNHARMWFASIWIHTLRLPWELGADVFLRHLLDGDPASNTLGWRWVAGLQTRGKPYAADPEAIAALTGGRFEAGPLARQLTPPDRVTALTEPEPPAARPVPTGDDLPAGGTIGLLLHEDDLHPDFLLARGLRPDGVAVLTATGGRSPLGAARHVHDFTDALARDAAARVHAPTGPIGADAAAFLDWGAAFDHIVAPHAPVGPARAALDALPLATLRPLRAWDAAAWPHADAGFFRFRRRTDDILATIPQDMGT